MTPADIERECLALHQALFAVDDRYQVAPHFETSWKRSERRRREVEDLRAELEARPENISRWAPVVFAEQGVRMFR